ncbi:hypothetical protein BT96DRAFT_978647 [Gymnopus androsaceus JB14]|uniref:Uncharacterized protein n=1 Tax=Gymnopus androsaceus JB14 TaxID=1447944 RepID=A0A6A4H8Q7_9AGAR|nr:hypothetical protein BT96DRAFT_978647 [Gymnopus androsaceus JB14]
MTTTNTHPLSGAIFHLSNRRISSFFDPLNLPPPPPPPSNRPTFLGGTRNPNIPLAGPPPIPENLLGPQKQALLYGFTFDDSTAKARELSDSFDLSIFIAGAINKLGLEGCCKCFAHALDDDLYLYYFAMKCPWGNNIRTLNDEGSIPSDELMEKFSTMVNFKPHWYGYEDATEGRRCAALWDWSNPAPKDYDWNATEPEGGRQEREQAR